MKPGMVRTPADVHYGLATDKADRRRSVLTDAHARHPHRFATTRAENPRPTRHRLDQPTSPTRHPGGRRTSRLIPTGLIHLENSAPAFWPPQLQALTGQHIAIRDDKAVITDTAA